MDGRRTGAAIAVASPDDAHGGSIQVVDLRNGSVETLYDSCEGRLLSSSNDLVFDDRDVVSWRQGHALTVGMVGAPSAPAELTLQPNAQRYAFAIATRQEPPIPGHHQHAVELRVQQAAPDSQRTLLWGTLLQFGIDRFRRRDFVV